MRKMALPLLVLLLSSIGFAQTQTATFSFGALGSDNCSAITAWNGVPNGYPEEMGEICFNLYPNPYSGMEIPWQLGFPNNGFLENQTPFTWGPMVYTGSTTYTQTGTAAYTGYGAGVRVNVQANFSVTAHRTCYRGVCRTYTVAALNGGDGTVTD